MTIEYNPVGIACNLKCGYCYQDPMRDSGNINVPRSWDKARKVLEEMNWEFSVFGGEPLLAPIEHLEEVWKFGFERFGRNGLQTNGTLITDAHIELFQRYKVNVGISIDGPGSLNSLRPSTVASSDTTDRTLLAIERLCNAGIPPSLIVTIHPVNAGGDRLLELLAWLDNLEKIGVKYINFHMLEVEKGMKHLAFSEEQNIDVFIRLYLWSKSSKMRVEPFCDIRKLLTERYPHVSCIWNHCDPATTDAVQGVSADGSRSNCGRTNKDGVNWVKAEEASFERYLLLHQTPQAVGGCRGCSFFVFCKGQCPGTAIDGDWRNRTADCRTWYALFQRVEQDILRDGILPISQNCQLKSEMEHDYLRIWAGGDSHGDAPHGDSPHGDSHGDSPHGDAHADSDMKYEGGIPGVLLNEPPRF